ncbi:MAG: hypothetical protein RLZZ584_148, partial [Pseudomonadota bacterium]
MSVRGSIAACQLPVRQWQTLNELTRLCGDVTAHDLSRHCAVGMALEFVVGSPVDYSGMPLGQYLLRVEHSIDRARLVVVFDRYGQCAGYAHLAAVKPEFRGPVLKFGPQAVNSGALADEGDLFMLDFRAVPGMLPSFMSYLRDGPLKRESSVIYFRYKNNKRMAKRISRSDGSAFARKSEAIALADDPPFLLSHQACTFFLPTTQQFLWRMAALGELAVIWCPRRDLNPR